MARTMPVFVPALGLRYTDTASRRGPTMNVFTKFQEAAAGIGYWNAVLFAASRTMEALFGGRVRLVKYHITVQPVGPPSPDRWVRTGTFELSWANADCPMFADVERPRRDYQIAIRARRALSPCGQQGSPRGLCVVCRRTL